ncbi:hypothetical protein GCM10011425_37040 [Mucilaginibacter galii]|uniref:Class I SAM-dependent methyltransferase n=2 Tax=Mucilaginibacter galii TaxID=2005073 RepID=A0A917N4T6_9SPHI|nr:hypothetical protein GCM10011425_37040 [Mucilaginibacter galii]
MVDEVIYDFSNKKVYAEIEKTAKADKKLTSTDKLLYRLVKKPQKSTVWILGKHRVLDAIILQHAAPRILKLNIEDNWKEIALPEAVFIDASLNPQSTIDYFNRMLPKMQLDTLLIVNNIHENRLTKTAWNVMKSYAKVTASVSLFWMGLIYCRPGQVKEDFWIKF